MSDNNNKNQITLTFGSIWIILTIIFVVLKLTNIIDWAWILVFLPIIISVSIKILIVVFLILLKVYSGKK